MTDDIVVNPYKGQIRVLFSNSKGQGEVDINIEANPIFGLSSFWISEYSGGVYVNYVKLFEDNDYPASDASVKSNVVYWNKRSLYFLINNYINHTTYDNKPFELLFSGSPTMSDGDYVPLCKIYRYSSDGPITIQSLTSDYSFQFIPRGTNNFGGIPFSVNDAAELMLVVIPTSSSSPALLNTHIDYKLIGQYGLYEMVNYVRVLQWPMLVMTEAYTTELDVNNKCVKASTSKIFDGTPYLPNMYDYHIKYPEIITPDQLYGGGKALVAFYSAYPNLTTLDLDYLSFSFLEFDSSLSPGMPSLDDSSYIYGNYIMYCFGIRNSDVSVNFYAPYYSSNTNVMIFIKAGDGTWVRYKANKLSDSTPPFDVIYDDDSIVPRNDLANIAVVITTDVAPRYSLEFYYYDGGIGNGNNYIYAHTLLG